MQKYRTATALSEFLPKRAAKKGLKNLRRSPKIKNLPGGFFTIAGKPSRMFHVTTSYSRIILNQKEIDAWDKSRKSKRKDKQKERPKTRVIVRTHNKEYAQKIKVQDTARKQNGYFYLKIRWKLIEFYKKQAPFTREQVSTLHEMVHTWGEQTKKLLEGEKFFLKKGENNPSRRLAVNRVNFVIQNMNSIGLLLENALLRRRIESREYSKLISELDELADNLRGLKIETTVKLIWNQ
ncbi:MAG: hypothetical protein WCW13_04170 [archaeon]